MWSLIKKKFFRKKHLTIIAVMAFFGAAVLVGVSYVAFRRLAFTASYDQARIRKLEKAAVRRAQLIKEGGTEVSFTSEDGIMLKGLLFERKRARASMVVCHGYHSIKEDMHRYIHMFEHFNVLLFDFRAHGESEGSVITIGVNEYKDVKAAAAAMKSYDIANGKKLPLVVLGVSMGGAAALKAASLEPDLCDAMVIDSSYANLWDVVRRVFTMRSGLPELPFLPIMARMFNFWGSADVYSMSPQEYVKQIKIPLFFIHSESDIHTSPEDSRVLYAGAVHEKSKLWMGPDAHHAQLHREHPYVYQHKVEKFLLNSLGISTSKREW